MSSVGSGMIYPNVKATNDALVQIEKTDPPKKVSA